MDPIELCYLMAVACADQAKEELVRSEEHNQPATATAVLIGLGGAFSQVGDQLRERRDHGRG